MNPSRTTSGGETGQDGLQIQRQIPLMTMMTTTAVIQLNVDFGPIHLAGPGHLP